MHRWRKFGTLKIVPADAQDLGLSEGDLVQIRSLIDGKIGEDSKQGVVWTGEPLAIVCRVSLIRNLHIHRQTAEDAQRMKLRIAGTFYSDIKQIAQESDSGMQRRNFLLLKNEENAVQGLTFDSLTDSDIIEALSATFSVFAQPQTYVHAVLTKLQQKIILEFLYANVTGLVAHDGHIFSLPKSALNKRAKHTIFNADLVLRASFTSLKAQNRKSSKACAETYRQKYFRVSKDTTLHVLCLPEVLNTTKILNQCESLYTDSSIHPQIQHALALMLRHFASDAKQAPLILLRTMDGCIPPYVDEVFQKHRILRLKTSLSEFIEPIGQFSLQQSAQSLGNCCIHLTDAPSFLSPHDSSDEVLRRIADLGTALGIIEKTNPPLKRCPVLITADEIHAKVAQMATLEIDCGVVEKWVASKRPNSSASSKRSCLQSMQSTHRVFGMDAVFASLETAFRAVSASANLPTRCPHGVLLYGPPGCGKTSIIRQLAASKALPVKHLDCSQIFSRYVGESERFLREAFADARAIAPCILFIDEVEAVGSIRNTDRNDVATRLLSTLLAEIDGVTETPGVIFVGATNVPNLIDSALMRPGRFDKLIEIPLPNADTRRAMIEHYFVGANVSCNTDSHQRLISFLVSVTNGQSGAAVQTLVRTAIAQKISHFDGNDAGTAELSLGVEDFDSQLCNLQATF